MNLSRALDTDLPDLPPQRYETYFRFNPSLFTREDKTTSHTVINVLTKTSRLLTFTPEQWALVHMFDGRRSYEQLSAWWRKTCNIGATPEQLQKYAETLDESDFWLKTPQEESAALMNELMEDRQRVVRRKEPVSITRIYVWVHDADKEVTAVYRWFRWMYTPTFVSASLVALLLMICLWIARWEVIFADSAQYYSFGDKGLLDIVEFYLSFAFVGFFHEWGHALTAKHFGARVNRTGLMLVYTVPAFFVNLSGVWVSGGRFERICAILGGFWFEGMICCAATLVWWGTAIGTTAHDLAYKLILVGGIMPFVINMNPLIPLDGYLCLCEVIRLQGLKEKATHFFSAWVRKNVFRMPVTVPALPRRRAIFFASFAFLSGLYTYSMSLFLARITYRILLNYSPQWAFLPALLIALRLFKSRIRKFTAFCKAFYLDKKDLMNAHPKKLVLAAVAILVFALLPIWHDSVMAPFFLEAANNAVLRAEVPGRVRDVLVSEGDRIKAGAPLLQMDNVDLTAGSASAAAAMQIAGARQRQAVLRYVEQGRAQSELRQRELQLRLSHEQQSKLSIDAPIDGTVVTPRLADLGGKYVSEGTALVTIADERLLRARVYLLEADMHALTTISGHALKLPGRLSPIHGEFQGISPADQPVPDGLLPSTKIKGLQPPPHFVLTILLRNDDGSLRTGMWGEAKIFGERRSLADLLVRPLLEFVARKLW